MDIKIECTGFTGSDSQENATGPSGSIGFTGSDSQENATGPSGSIGFTEASGSNVTEQPISGNVYEIKEKPIISGDFDTLVLSGGSIHAMIMLGSLQYAVDNNILQKITTYVGASAGSICGYLLAIGYTPTEIMVYLCTKQVLERMKQFNLVAMMNGGGATSFSYIHELLERMTIEKIGRLITLKDLYNIFGKKLICTTYNMTADKSEILSHETYPDMPCLIALRMSSNLPFIFEHFQYLGSYYVDGGISNNFPVNVAEKHGNKIFGLVIYDVNTNFSKNPSNMIEYIYQIMSIPIKQNVTNNIEKASDRCHIVKINPDDTLFFNFNLDSHAKLEMFSNGYTQLQKHWES